MEKKRWEDKSQRKDRKKKGDQRREKSQKKEDAGARKGRKVVKHCGFPVRFVPWGVEK
jgi:hypothetical protein